MAPTARETHENDEPPTWRPRARAPRIGDVVSGKYRLVRELGSGGMGRIFAAEHLVLDALVALKFLHPHLAKDPVAVERFAREARASAMLKSAHVARVLDVDALPSGELFLVMEYLEGTSLETVAQSGRGLPIAEAVRFVAQACDALAEAHARGVIHRDVKPGNLFVTRTKAGDSVVKVLDFGLAKSELPDVFAGGVSVALGTPEYMSPEQIRGASDLDARTDVWSLGATLYELLAARPAFEGDGPVAIFTRIHEGSFLPLRALRPDVPPALAAIVERCLSRDPAARFATVTELAAALEGRSASVRAAPARFSTTMPSVGSIASVASIDRPVTWSSVPPSAMSVSVLDERERGPTRRQTMFAALAGPALIAVVAAGFALALGGAHGESMVPGTAPRADEARAVVVHVTARADRSAARAKVPATLSASPKCARTPRSRACTTAAVQRAAADG